MGDRGGWRRGGVGRRWRAVGKRATPGHRGAGLRWRTGRPSTDGPARRSDGWAKREDGAAEESGDVGERWANGPRPATEGPDYVGEGEGQGHRGAGGVGAPVGRGAMLGTEESGCGGWVRQLDRQRPIIGSTRHRG